MLRIISSSILSHLRGVSYITSTTIRCSRNDRNQCDPTIEQDTLVERILFVTAARGEQLLSKPRMISHYANTLAIALIRINLPSVSIELIPVDKYV